MLSRLCAACLSLLPALLPPPAPLPAPARSRPRPPTSSPSASCWPSKARSPRRSPPSRPPRSWPRGAGDRLCAASSTRSSWPAWPSTSAIRRCATTPCARPRRRSPRPAGWRPRTSTCCAPWATSTSISPPSTPPPWARRATPWRRCASATPADAQSFLTLGRIYLDQNQPDKAAEVFRELVNNVPQQRMAYALLVESLMRANKPDEAEKALHGHPRLRSRLPGGPAHAGRPAEPARQTATAVLETLRGAPEEAARRPAVQAPARLGALPERRPRRGAEGARPLRRRLGRRQRRRTSPEAGSSLPQARLIFAAQGRTTRRSPCSPRSESRAQGHRARRHRGAGDAARRPARRRRRACSTHLADALAKDGKAKEARRRLRLEAAQV